MKNISIFVGLDVHKESIDIALVEDDRNSAVRYYGTIGGDLADLEKAVKKTKKAHPKLPCISSMKLAPVATAYFAN